MKKLFHTLLITAAVGAALPVAAQEEADSTAENKGFRFTDVVTVPATPVKDQSKSGTCWSFSGVGHLESEILKNGGKETDLAEMFAVRQVYLDKAKKYMRLGGQANFGPGGAVTDVLYVAANYGLLPQEAYPGINYGEEKHTHGELDAAIEAYVKAVNRHPNRRLSTAWEKGLEGILDAYLGEVPQTFTVDGKTYTPHTYAASLGIDVDAYIPVTSFTHHPYYTQFPLEVSDNWLWANYYNVELDELQQIVDNALEQGYTVVWAADVSEPGFKWKKGVALMPADIDENDLEGTELARWVALTPEEKKKDKYEFSGPVAEENITPETRQQWFDRMETTDDHGMLIVGKAVDDEGNPYYKVKNSWGADNHIYDGYLYVSMPYFRAKTLSLLVNKKALPKQVASKLNIK